MKEYSRRFIYDPHSNILWCQIPKTGSTTYIDAYNKIARMYGRGNFGRLGKQHSHRERVKKMLSFNEGRVAVAHLTGTWEAGSEEMENLRGNGRKWIARARERERARDPLDLLFLILSLSPFSFLFLFPFSSSSFSFSPSLIYVTFCPKT